MSKFITGKEFYDILENKKKITFKWPDDEDFFVWLYPLTINGQELIYITGYEEGNLTCYKKDYPIFLNKENEIEANNKSYDE